MSLVMVVLLSPVSLSCALYLLYPHPLLSIVQFAYSVLIWYHNCHLRLPLSHAFPCPTPILSLQAYSPPPVSYAALCCFYHILHRSLCSTRMSFFAVRCVWIRQGLAYLTHTCVQSLHSKTAHGVPTPPALSPIPVFSLHNLGLPTEFIHCPIYHAHTCVQP